MKICIIICSYNRASVLRETLESFLSLEFPKDFGVELLVVDNNSSDDTPRVAEEFCTRAPALIRRTTERTPGLSFARNCGIRASDADLIAFVDDDVYFDTHWLTEIVKPFEQNRSAMCVGGRSDPVFEQGTPNWVSQRILKIYGSTNSGSEVHDMKYPEHPFGLNMVFRREVFDRVGLFDTSLGRKKKSLLSNEETELFYRVDRAGLSVIYTPFAIIQHRIPASRACKKWALRRYYWQGISDVAFRQLMRPDARFTLLRQAKWGANTVFSTFMRMAWRNARDRRQPASDKFQSWLECFYHCGVIRQSLIEAVRRRPEPAMHYSPDA